MYRGTTITEAVKARLELINRDGGYSTEIGRKVFVAELRGTPTDVPCIYLLPARTIGSRQYGVGQRERTYTITCVVNRKEVTIDDYPTAPYSDYAIIDAMIADVTIVIESAGAFDNSLVENVTYEGDEPVFSDDGGALVGVQITYSIRFAIGKGDPANPPS